MALPTFEAFYRGTGDTQGHVILERPDRLLAVLVSASLNGYEAEHAEIARRVTAALDGLESTGRPLEGASLSRAAQLALRACRDEGMAEPPFGDGLPTAQFVVVVARSEDVQIAWSGGGAALRFEQGRVTGRTRPQKVELPTRTPVSFPLSPEHAPPAELMHWKAGPGTALAIFDHQILDRAHVDVATWTPEGSEMPKLVAGLREAWNQIVAPRPGPKAPHLAGTIVRLAWS